MNLIERWQGQRIDLPLNATGIKQARELAGELKEKGLEIIFSSPLKRAVQTAEIIADILQIPVQVENGLIEGCFGEAEGKTKQEIRTLYPQIAGQWHCLSAEFMDIRFEGGETKRQIQQRILKTLEKIARENDSAVVGISAHSAVVRCFALLFGIKLYTVPNGRPFHVRFDNDGFEWAEQPDPKKVL